MYVWYMILNTNEYAAQKLKDSFEEKAIVLTLLTAFILLIYMEINPNAFATELIKIMAAKIGHKYLIIKRKICLLLNGCPSCTTSSSILSTPTTLGYQQTSNRCNRHHNRVCQEIKEI